jgi:hypothetical protein
MKDEGNSKVDIAVAIGKGVVGSLPFIGPLVAEVVGTIIPNQRIDRIERFVKKLDEKVKSLDREDVEERFASLEFVDLLEDGMYQAAQTLSDERLDYISSLLKNGLADDELRHIELKRLLSLLDEINDAEVVILRAQAYHSESDPETSFRERHQNVLKIRAAHKESSQREVDEAAIYSNFKNHLERLGLLRPRFKRPRRGEPPEFDRRTGKMKTSGHEITPLGRLLLRQIDLIPK